MSHERMQSCIDACVSCGTECEHCATECLREDDVKKMADCILLDRECALVCFSTAQLMTIGGENATLLCSACADICEACAVECEKHEADHCQRCAEECRSCAEECRRMAEELV